MIRKLLATTAMAGLFATGAFAQETTTPAPAAPATGTAADTMAPGATATPAPAGEMGASADAGAGAASGSYMQRLESGQHLVSELDDQDIYAGSGADAQSLGEIQNYLVDADGKVAAAIIQATVNDESRTVALPFDQIQWSMGENNEPRATMTNAEALNTAPIFVERQAAAAAPAATGAAGTGMSAGTNASGTAMTPAPAAGTGDMAATGAAPAGETMMQGEDQYLTSNLVGQDIRGGAGDDADNIGEVNDLVISDAGQVDAAVVGVGGFLGIGQKNVAVPFGEFQVTRNEGADPLFVLAATKEQLEQAPAFEGREQSMAANTAGSAGTMGSDMAATGAAAGAAAGAAVGGAATTASNMANDAGNAMTGATETAQNQNGMATTGTTAGTAAGTDAATTASTGGSSRDNMMPVDAGAQLTADELMGTTVYGPNDDSLGSVGDIAMNAEGQVDAVIVDVGGFLGIGAKPVAVGLDNVQLMRDQGDKLYIYTQFSKDQLENAPAYDQASYAENRDTMRLQGSAPAATGTATDAAPAAGAASTTAN